MRVFVTGSTGFIGTAVVQELIRAGHTVLGLARSDASAQKLTQAGADVHRGSLTDADSLAAGARDADGVIHLAFDHELMAQGAWADAADIDRQVTTAMTDALTGTDKPFVLTSGTGLLAFTFGPGHVGTEDETPAAGLPRAASEAAALKAAGQGVRSSIVRLPPSVHGAGDQIGFVPILIDAARRTGFSAYVGDGDNRWPAVHRLDAARLFRLALEKAAPGTVLHGVAEEGVLVKSVAEAIGAGLGVPVQSITPDDAAAHFAWFANFAGMDNPSCNARTRELLDWQPQQPGLLTDIHDHYFG